MEMYPVVMLGVAFTRLRVCLCMGNASILISKKSAVLTFLSSIMLAVIFALGWSIICPYRQNVGQQQSHQPSHDSDTQRNTTTPFLDDGLLETNVSKQPDADLSARNNQSPWVLVSHIHHTTLMLVYRCSTLVCFGFIPICLTMAVYAKIYTRVVLTKSRTISVHTARQSVFCIAAHREIGRVTKNPQGKVKQEANILFSLCLLSIIFVLTWSTYMSLSIYSLIHHSIFLDVMLAFSRVFIFFFHPIGEGLPLYNKRQNLLYMVSKIPGCCYVYSENKSVITEITSYNEESLYARELEPSCNVLATVEEEGSSTNGSPFRSETHACVEVDRYATLQKQMSSDSVFQRRTGVSPPLIYIPEVKIDEIKRVLSAEKAIDSAILSVHSLHDSPSSILLTPKNLTTSPSLQPTTPSPSPHVTRKTTANLKSCMKPTSRSTSPRQCPQCFGRRMSSNASMNRYKKYSTENMQSVRSDIKCTSSTIQSTGRLSRVRFDSISKSPHVVSPKCSESMTVRKARRCTPVPTKNNVFSTAVPATRASSVSAGRKRKMSMFTSNPIQLSPIKTVAKELLSNDSKRSSQFSNDSSNIFKFNPAISPNICAVCKTQMSVSKPGVVRFNFPADSHTDRKPVLSSIGRDNINHMLSRHF